MIADPEWNFLLIPNEPIFVGEISGGLFVSGQQLIGMFESTGKCAVDRFLKDLCKSNCNIAVLFTTAKTWKQLVSVDR